MSMHPTHTIDDMPDTQYPSSQPPNVHVMGLRVVATILDFIPLGLLTWMVNTTFGIDQNLSVISAPAGIPYASSTSVAVPCLYLLLITYYTVQEALFGATFGKFLVGLRVIKNDGSPLTLTGALLRNIVRPIDATSGYLLGWFVALLSSHRCRIGDHLGRTLVVSVESLPARSRHVSYLWRKLCMLTILCAVFLAFCQGFDYFGRPPLVIQSMANNNVPATAFADRGTITNLKLGQQSWQNNTVTYAISFQAKNHDTLSNCHGQITLIWPGPNPGWVEQSDNVSCGPMP